MLPLLFLAALPFVEPEPTLADLKRFPSAQAVAGCLDFSHRYEAHCRQQADGCAWAHVRQYWVECATEAEQMRGPWETLSGARSSDYGGGYRLYCLRELRLLLGPARYWQGAMPPAIPLWRWTERP